MGVEGGEVDSSRAATTRIGISPDVDRESSAQDSGAVDQKLAWVTERHEGGMTCRSSCVVAVVYGSIGGSVGVGGGVGVEGEGDVERTLAVELALGLDLDFSVVSWSHQASQQCGDADLILGPGMAAACIAGLAWHRGRSERGGLWTRPAVYGQDSTSPQSTAQHSRKNERAEKDRAGQNSDQR
jgi:hypothetical protein